MVTTGSTMLHRGGAASGVLGSIAHHQQLQELRNVVGSVRFARRSEPRSVCVRAAAAAAAEKDKGKRNRNKEPKERASRADLIEEDIYTVDDGWKVHIEPTEEMIEIAGVQVPVRLKQQLQNERYVRNRSSESSAAPKKAEAPPRLTHKLMRVMAGSVAGKKLTSCADLKVRPMMEVVRGAVFNILQSLSGWSSNTPSGRWLDLYSGTGSVAIEALSRGCCGEAHFVEMDPWVITNVLHPNLEETNFGQQATIHTSRVENLLQRVSERGAELLGGGFDFVSVTPPYEAVSYTALMAQLASSPVITDNTFMVVEYPIKSRHEIPDTCGKLLKVRDRRYGRTFVAIYGPEWVDRD